MELRDSHRSCQPETWATLGTSVRQPSWLPLLCPVRNVTCLSKPSMCAYLPCLLMCLTEKLNVFMQKLILTMNLRSGENSRCQQSSEDAHLLLGSWVFGEPNPKVAKLGSISLSVCEDSNPHLTAPSLALVWLALSSSLAEANPLWLFKIKTVKGSMIQKVHWACTRYHSPTYKNCLSKE